MNARFTMPDKRRSARDAVASFPSYVAVDASNEGLGIICIEPGMKGYRPFDIPPRDLEQADRIVQRWGADRAPTEIEREAAYVGSMFGWDAPGADPLNYRATKQVNNLMSGKEITIDADTPRCCDPSTELYWSM